MVQVMRRIDYQLFIDELFRLCRTLPIQAFDGTPESLGSIGIAWNQELSDVVNPLNKWFVETPYAKTQEYINYITEPITLGVVLYWPTILRTKELRSAVRLLLKLNVSLIEQYDYILASALQGKLNLPEHLFDRHLNTLLDNPTVFKSFYVMLRRTVFHSRWPGRIKFLWGCFKTAHRAHCSTCPTKHWLRDTTTVCYANDLFLHNREAVWTFDLQPARIHVTEHECLIRYILSSHSIEEGFEPIGPDTGMLDSAILEDRLNIPQAKLIAMLSSVDDPTNIRSLIDALEITRAEKAQLYQIRKETMFPGI